MERDGLAGGSRQTIKLAHLLQGMDGGREIMLHQDFAFIREEAAHDKDAGLADAARAEVGALLNRADRQPLDAFAQEYARYLQRAMAVGIGLDHSRDIHLGPNHGADITVITS